MEYDLDAGTYSTYSPHDHIVVKYRREGFTKELTQFLHEVVNGFADNDHIEIKNLEADGAHVNLLFEAIPTIDLAKFITVLNGASAQRSRNEYGDQITDELWGVSFLLDLYCTINTGQVLLDVLNEYVENHPDPEDE